MGIEAFNVASAVNLVVAQRLVRRICKDCKAPAVYSDEELRTLGTDLESLRTIPFMKGKGCDTCGGLGYFAACCLEAGAARIHSFEKNADVLWLRSLNPWSPDPDAPANDGRLQLVHADVAQAIVELPDASVDAVLHDPPRFGIAGELYSRAFYDQLARVLRRGGQLFHYTGTPNRMSMYSRLARAFSDTSSTVWLKPTSMTRPGGQTIPSKPWARA